jgi:uncharacterized protein
MAYRMLTLDGGGAWALIQVRTLINLYGANARGHDVLKNFDLVAANSGGTLVLGGLVENLSLSAIAQYFLDQQNRQSIFSPTTSIPDRVLEATVGLGPKYSATAKLPAIERLLPQTGNAPLAGSMDDIPGPAGAPVHLLIVGFDYDLNRAVYFRSAAASGPALGVGEPATVTLAEALHASTNAPVNYFDAPAIFPGDAGQRQYWDGAITGNNNPVLCAVTEALVLGQQPGDLRALSLGTANVAFPLAAAGTTAGPLETARSISSLAGDLQKLATSILDDPPDAATFIAHAVTGGSSGLDAPIVSRIVRMNPLISPLVAAGGALTPPQGWSFAQFQYLSNIGMDAVAQTDVSYVDAYCATWLADDAPNQPIRPKGSSFDPWNPEIGYAKFSQARNAWSQLFP